MARRITGACVLVAVLFSAAIPLLAHHSFGAEYDANKPITLTGVVTKVGKFEGYNPAVLQRIGWKKDTTIKPGDKITVTGWRARDGGNWAHSREITLPDGKKLFFGPPAGTGDGGASPAVDVQ
jgi:hypothetical protein